MRKNVRRVRRSTVSQVRALHNIIAGAEIFVNFGPAYDFPEGPDNHWVSLPFMPLQTLN